MKPNISSRTDIQFLIDSFYTKVRQDATIGHIFNDIAKVDWLAHLPRMYDFWEAVLFQTGDYSGNPMFVHKQLNQKVPLLKEHFVQWQNLFLQTVDELFEGDKAELAKQRAQSIATMMQIKIGMEP